MTIARRKATHARHFAEAAQKTDADDTKHWITRAANFVTVVSEAMEGAVLSRTDQVDEYMVFVVTGAATIEAGRDRGAAAAETLSIVPPGPSRITMRQPGLVVRVLTNKASDLIAAAGNAATYADGAPEVAPIVPLAGSGRRIQASHLPPRRCGEPGSRSAQDAAVPFDQSDDQYF